MMTLEISKEEFERVVYVATSTNSSVYEAVMPFIKDAMPTMEALLQEKGVSAMGGDELLKKNVKAYLCEMGFVASLRHLSLTLTSAGFGVVSNDHVAPASSDKINDLEKALRKSADRHLCSIIGKLMTVEGWGEKSQYAVPCLVWDIGMAEEFLGKPEMDHSAWVTTKRNLYDAQFKLSAHISHELVEELLGAMRCNNATDIQRDAIHELQRAICNLINNEKDSKRCTYIINRTINYFEDRLEKFPTYKKSTEYKVRHAKRYENTAEAPAFFFGA